MTFETYQPRIFVWDIEWDESMGRTDPDALPSVLPTEVEIMLDDYMMEDDLVDSIRHYFSKEVGFPIYGFAFTVLPIV
jgi:hypothetical protein